MPPVKPEGVSGASLVCLAAASPPRARSRCVAPLPAAQEIVKEVLAFAEMSGDAPVQPRPDARDFPALPPAPSPTPSTGSSVLSPLANGTPPSYRCSQLDLADVLCITLPGS